MALCKICKTNPACPDGVLCPACREHRPAPVINHKHYQKTNKEPGYSNVWRNLTAEQIQALRKKQAGKCAICNNRNKFLVLDHNHKTNKARGYLCRGCNTKLAGLDDVNFMGRAREYLDNPPAKNL